MANPQNLKPFKKGQSGNPGGKPKTPPDILAAKNMNKIEFERLLNKMIVMKKEDLMTLVKHPDSTAMEVMIGSIIVKAAVEGDHQRLDFILNRMIGKVEDKITTEHKHTLERVEYYKQLPEEELLRLAQEVKCEVKS